MNLLKVICTILIFPFLLGCNSLNTKTELLYLVDTTPEKDPLEFKIPFVDRGKLVHKGIISPDFNEFYLTVSNPDFSNFEILVSKKEEGKWTKPQESFINSPFDDHGMCFSPDGKLLYFSSTRPVKTRGYENTWHIWKSKTEGKLDEPSLVDIPNLKNKLTSHPSVASSGNLYFHSSNTDYSDMHLYCSKKLNGEYLKAEKLLFENNNESNKCTPFIAPDESYVIFGILGEELELAISYREKNGKWGSINKIGKKVNVNGQGNPSITPDGKFMFFTTGGNNLNDSENNWKLNWISTKSFLK